MALKKDEVVAKLVELGIAHDPEATKAELEALLPEDKGDEGDGKDARQSRWDAFVESARKQAEKFGTMAKFLEKEKRGEFAKIPPTFK